MHYKILLLIIVAIVWAFFYLHNTNPATVDFTLDPDHIYNVPVTYLVIAGFFAGIVLSVANSLVVDIRRAVKDLRAMAERRRRESAEKSYRAGITELFKERPAKARSHFQKALDNNPKDVDLYLRLADAYEAEKNFSEAVAILDKGLVARPDSAELIIKKAEVFGASGDVSAAEAALEKVVEADSSNAHAMELLRDLKAEKLKWAEAAELQKRIASAHKGLPDRAAADDTLALGYAYEDARRALDETDYDRVFLLGREMIKRDARFTPAHVIVGEAHLKQDNIEAAMRAWESGYEATQDPVFLLKLEEASFKSSDPQKILDDFSKAIETNPGDKDLSVLRARLYLRLEMIDDAMAELERIRSEEEENSYADVLLGEAYMKRNLFDRAAAAFRKALRHEREIPVPPFECGSCRTPAREWSGRCKSCGSWNVVRFNRVGAMAAARPVAGVPVDERSAPQL